MTFELKFKGDQSDFNFVVGLDERARLKVFELALEQARTQQQNLLRTAPSLQVAERLLAPLPEPTALPPAPQSLSTPIYNPPAAYNPPATFNSPAASLDLLHNSNAIMPHAPKGLSLAEEFLDPNRTVILPRKYEGLTRSLRQLKKPLTVIFAISFCLAIIRTTPSIQSWLKSLPFLQPPKAAPTAPLVPSTPPAPSPAPAEPAPGPSPAPSPAPAEPAPAEPAPSPSDPGSLIDRIDRIIKEQVVP